MQVEPAIPTLSSTEKIEILTRGLHYVARLKETDGSMDAVNKTAEIDKLLTAVKNAIEYRKELEAETYDYEDEEGDTLAQIKVSFKRQLDSERKARAMYAKTHLSAWLDSLELRDGISRVEARGRIRPGLAAWVEGGQLDTPFTPLL